MYPLTQKAKITQQIKSNKPLKVNQTYSKQNQGVHSILYLQHKVGNQTIQQLLQPDTEQHKVSSVSNFDPTSKFSQSPTQIQSKRTVNINTSKDIYEQEADRFAKQVMHMPESKLQHIYDHDHSEKGTSPQVSQLRKCNRLLQTWCGQASNSDKTTVPPIVDNVLRSTGQPLDSTSKAYFEPKI